MIEKRGGKYRVKVFHRGRYVAGRTFSRKREAEQWERRQKDALAAGTWVRPADADATVSEWVESWWRARHENKPSTTARYRSLLDRHLLPHWGRRPLTSIGRLEVQAWATTLAEDRSPSTARQALLLLRGAMQAAVDDGLLQRNPAAGVRLPGMRANDPRPLTHEQLWRLAMYLGPRDRALVLVMGYGGLRFGEVAALRRRDVHEHGRRLWLREAVAEVSGVLHLGTLKDHEQRGVVLPGTAAVEVWSWSRTRSPNQILFPSGSDTYLRNGNWRRNSLDPALRALSLPAITPHNLRDTAATLAINAGASVVAVARLLGHESPSTTLRHYAGWFPDDLGATATRTDKAARRARGAYE